MKKVWMVLAIVAFSLVIAQGLCQAGILENLPDVKQGVGYDLSNDDGGNVLSLTTVDVVTWKDKVSIGGGVMTELDNDENIDPAITINYKIGGLEDLGFTYPLAKYVKLEVGGFIGKDLDAEHYRFGVQGTIIKVKF